jgi:hypothetical protein
MLNDKIKKNKNKNFKNKILFQITVLYEEGTLIAPP